MSVADWEDWEPEPEGPEVEAEVVGGRGEVFLWWLGLERQQSRGDGCGAFARWVVCAVADGELEPKDTWYPASMRRKSGQFPEADWRDARAMYIESLG